MNLAGVQRLTCSLSAVPRLHSRLDISNRALITSSSAGPAVRYRASAAAPLTQTSPDPPSHAPPERSEDIRSLRPCLRVLCPRLAWCLSLLLLVGLSACGPAPSDHAPSLGGPSESQPASQNSPSSRNNPVTPASNPVPVPGQNEAAVPLPDRLVSPDLIAQRLAVAQGSKPPEDEEEEDEEEEMRDEREGR